jgi:hypothetical protein
MKASPVILHWRMILGRFSDDALQGDSLSEDESSHRAADALQYD